MGSSDNGIWVFFGVITPFLFLGMVFFAVYRCRSFTFRRKLGGNANGRRRRTKWGGGNGSDREVVDEEVEEEEEEEEEEDLMVFPGGEELSIHGILDAPGEVVGKSSYSTMYKASLQMGKGKAVTLLLLRFIRPTCMGRTREIFPSVQVLGFVRHSNLVPLWALYVGPRGEKLLVHPFFLHGSLSHFLKDGTQSKSYTWDTIHKLSVGIAKGIDHLHNALARPIIHGNLKSKNILLDLDLVPHLSDYGLHLLLSSTAAQEMLDISALEGYKATELIKMKDVCRETDIYSLGVIFLEMLTRKEPTATNLLSSWELHLPTSVRNLALERKLPGIFSPELLSRGENQGFSNNADQQRLLSYFQLAMSCCSPSPSLRPDIKQVLRILDEIN